MVTQPRLSEKSGQSHTTLEWVGWFTSPRLHSELGYLTRTKYEGANRHTLKNTRNKTQSNSLNSIRVNSDFPTELDIR